MGYTRQHRPRRWARVAAVLLLLGGAVLGYRLATTPVAAPPLAASDCRTAPATPLPASAATAQFATNFEQLPAGVTTADTGHARFAHDAVHHAYLIANNQPFSIASSLLTPDVTPTRIQVVATLVAGDPATAAGVLFGVQPDGSHYRLSVAYTGFYRLDYITPQAEQAILAWTPVPAQAQWQAMPLPHTRLLLMTLQGDTFGLELDASELERLRLAQPIRGPIGIAVSSFAQGGVVCFGQVVVW